LGLDSSAQKVAGFFETTVQKVLTAYNHKKANTSSHKATAAAGQGKRHFGRQLWMCPTPSQQPQVPCDLVYLAPDGGPNG
jgi:hypothetical protein